MRDRSVTTLEAYDEARRQTHKYPAATVANGRPDVPQDLNAFSIRPIVKNMFELQNSGQQYQLSCCICKKTEYLRSRTRTPALVMRRRNRVEPVSRGHLPNYPTFPPSISTPN